LYKINDYMIKFFLDARLTHGCAGPVREMNMLDNFQAIEGAVMMLTMGLVKRLLDMV
jgi:hypothetical protein